MAEKENVDVQEESTYVNVKFPRGFAHPYSFTDQNGKEWNKAIINIPPNTVSNGIDLSGYSVDVFLNSFQQSQIANDEAISCSFREGNKVELFKGKGDDRQTLMMDPWALTRAVKTQREEFAAQKAAEREAAQKEDYSLSSEQHDASAAKEELAGKDGQAQAPQTR